MQCPDDLAFNLVDAMHIAHLDDHLFASGIGAMLTAVSVIDCDYVAVSVSFCEWIQNWPLQSPYGCAGDDLDVHRSVHPADPVYYTDLAAIV